MAAGDYAKTVSALRAAFDSGATLDLAYRRAQLGRLAHMLTEQEGRLCDALYKDLRRPKLEALTTEVAFTLNEVNTAVKELDRWAGQHKVSRGMLQLLDAAYVRSEPLGLVLIIAPWNYPYQLALCPLVGAIAAGNCAIVKPSELAVHTTALLAELLPKYLDTACYALAQGGPDETAALLAERFDHIFYTGGPAVGRRVLRAAAEHLTPVTLELGGKSPCVVSLADGVDIATAARRLTWAKFVNNGQTCVAPDYVLAVGEEDRRRALVGHIKACIKEFYGDEPKAAADYGRIINGRHFDRLHAMLSATGGETVAGGADKCDRDSLYIPPTVVDGVGGDDSLMKDEIFGPILPVVGVPDLQSAVGFVRGRPKPLVAYVFAGGDSEPVRAFERGTSSGALVVNDCMMHCVVDTLPFGGVGESGTGRCHGKYSFDAFSHEKAVLHRTLGAEKLLWMRYPPYDERKEYWAGVVGVRRKLPFM